MGVINSAIMTSFLGMELAAVHVKNVHSHSTQFSPCHVFFSYFNINNHDFWFINDCFCFYLKKKINLVDGVMQAFTDFFQAYHLTALMPAVIILLLIGSLGSMINWIISPAKGLLLAANHGFLPQSLYSLNRHGVASRILLLQAVLVTLLCGGFLLFPSINAIYWLFTALSTELYIMMYVLMFLAAWRLKSKFTCIFRVHSPSPRADLAII